MHTSAGASRRRWLRSLSVAAPAVALILAAHALADTTKVRDNRNTRANLFDIKSATAAHKGHLLSHTIRTYRGWRSKELRSTRRQPRIMCIYIWKEKSNPRSSADYQLCAKFSRRKLRGYAFDVRSARRSNKTVKVRRLDLQSVTIRFPASTIGGPDSYKWQAVSGYTGKRCPRDPPFRYGCDDSVPTGRAQSHDLTPEPEEQSKL
jgi:hypothetical protein